MAALKTGLQQKQKLTMTTDMRQSLEILQLNTLSLSEMVREELETNPVLEELQKDAGDVGNDGNDIIEDLIRQLSFDNFHADDIETGMVNFSEYSDAGLSCYEEDDRRRGIIENAITDNETLAEHLLSQVRFLNINSKQYGIIESIITGLDENGLFFEDLTKFAVDNDISEDELKKCISIIQSLDPVGCGSSSVIDNLLYQAGVLYPDDDLIYAIIKDHFDNLKRLQFDKIAKDLYVEVPMVIQAGKKIQELNPYPGNMFSGGKSHFVAPEFEVLFRDGNLIINYINDWIPEIGINKYYLGILQKKNIDKNLNSYIKDRIKCARSLIKNIGSRRETVLKILTVIIDSQKDFFIKGPGYLKPLLYSDVSSRLDIHESTVSRGVSGKYVRTKWGVFELKYFFKGRATSGDDASADEVMRLIKEIIENENSEKPETDDDIARKLNNIGIETARRTVAKYRGILNIPSSNQRKKQNMLKTESKK